MKYILGYLNQGENLQNVTIGNMMQLQTYDIRDLLQESENELELSRESFLNKITLTVVAYFCYSTEIRFIIQTREDPTFDNPQRRREQEYWHTKCLEMACTFLPGECPLLGHINMTHQKHYAPVRDVIDENLCDDDEVRVIKPANGVDLQRYHPIIKIVDDKDMCLTPYQMTPLNVVTGPFINQLKDFTESTEAQRNPLIS